MGLFRRKKEKVVKDYMKEEVDGAEIYVVSWDARYGTFNTEKKRVAKAFLNDDDAKAFEESLYEAKRLLQYTENLNITVEKQK